MITEEKEKSWENGMAMKWGTGAGCVWKIPGLMFCSYIWAVRLFVMRFSKTPLPPPYISQWIHTDPRNVLETIKNAGNRLSVGNSLPWYMDTHTWLHWLRVLWPLFPLTSIHLQVTQRLLSHQTISFSYTSTNMTWSVSGHIHTQTEFGGKYIILLYL